MHVTPYFHIILDLIEISGQQVFLSCVKICNSQFFFILTFIVILTCQLVPRYTFFIVTKYYEILRSIKRQHIMLWITLDTLKECIVTMLRDVNCMEVDMGYERLKIGWRCICGQQILGTAECRKASNEEYQRPTKRSGHKGRGEQEVLCLLKLAAKAY